MAEQVIRPLSAYHSPRYKNEDFIEPGDRLRVGNDELG